MTRTTLAALLVLLLALPPETAHAQSEAAAGVSASSDTVHVAPPTGERETDRASILDALEQVGPGGTVQFAPGTYLIGPLIRVPTDEITLLGHPDGTVIRGCEPDDFPDPPAAVFACHGFELTGARQTVRNLTFEYTWHGLFVGCCFPADEEAVESGGAGPLRSQPGGHMIESNTFRYTPNGLRVIGESAEPTVVRDNYFIDVYHAVQINGGAVHVLDNDIGVRNPERVPSTNYPGDAINILPFSSMLDLLQSPTEDHTSCSGNIIARNRIEGYPDGIRIFVADPKTSCRRNEISDNTIVVGRARRIATDSTIVGVPLRLSNWARAGASDGEAAADALVEDNLIEGNHIIGAEGIGIEILHASGNRIASNAFTGIQRREPFPGNTLGGEPERWRDANGSAIWVSPGSDNNEIVGNKFEDVASFAVVLEGNNNHVELGSEDDAVRDLGSGNSVSRSDSVQTRIIEVDGHAVHVFTAGWEHLERGQPVVVFEAGGFSTLDAWGDLPAHLAQETAVVAYDRAGRGRSEWDGQRPTLEHVTSRLRRILEVLDAPPPYIHVGHSIGGPLGLAFAHQYPDELAGLVLVDPMPPSADWLGAFDDIGVGRDGHDEFVALLGRAFEGAPEPLLIELDVVIGYLSDPGALLWSPPDLLVPVAVLLAGAGYEVPSDLPSTWDLDQQHQALLLRQIVNYAEWTRTVPDATMIVANNSRHCIHCWDPELVIGAIRRVLYSDVRVQLRQAIAADGISAIAPTYDALKSRYPDSHFDESRLESLGRELLGFGKSEAAIAVFALNVREYPDMVRPHESLADAYRAAGRLDDARDSYERASHLAEANASARLSALRRKLEDIEREQQRSQPASSKHNNRR